ncbi:hypothetical protein (DUF2089) (plasmid) [Streptococcus infantarius subsp. infantarius CJ18]|nr:hypothetical protein (DUF2089) [Streptococcus infantarius subsp. infantarius CJ18]
MFTFNFNNVKIYLTLLKFDQKGEHMDWFLDLEEEEQEFIKRFILASGSLKQLAKDYEVSYPTVRIRVDKIIEKIKLKNYNQDSFKVKLMQMVIDEKVSLDSAKEIIREYEDSING